MAQTWAGSPVTRLRAWIEANVLPSPCPRCSRLVTPADEWDIDHLVPISEGGSMWSHSNLAPAHSKCNRSHGGKLGRSLQLNPSKRIRAW